MQETNSNRLTVAREKKEIELIGNLDAVGSVLEVISKTTGLRIALVAKVTPRDWTCCAVLDEAGFGLGPGDTLDVSTTY